jgi:hypothetical protein
MTADPHTGWGWFEGASASARDPAELERCRAYARCFAGPDGDEVIAHLTRSILDRRLSPNASDAELRHLEGQRFAIAGIIAMVERGRA